MTDIATILIAEDNDFVRMQIVKYLQDSGYNTIEAHDGSEALNIVKSQDIDMTIVDVRMEPVDGFEFIKSIRGLNVQIPVILVTGDNSPDILERSGDWGVSAMLVKPIEKARLVKAVERSLMFVQKEKGRDL